MLLQISDLRTHFINPDGVAPAVDGVSLDIARGQTVALVGESGCGKSLTALSVLRLVPPPGRIVGGEVLFEGHDLLKLNQRQMRRIRGNRIAMVFQEPMTSLNPVLSIGQQIGEALRRHRGVRGKALRRRTVELLKRVGIPGANARINDYPHQMSGGMRQRVMIAMALACEPGLLIADEPTSALDVTIQAQILELLHDLQQQTGMSILLITHDLGLVAGFADAVCVMYAGRLVERAPAQRLFGDPRHPYTQALLRSMPRLAGDSNSAETIHRLEAGATPDRRRLEVIPGEVPRPANRPLGCPFHPRCELGHCDPTCQLRTPEMVKLTPEHECACWKARPS
jgi:oligopeptide/dipeptide ABC transporter ATP-binding protein